MGCKQLSLNEEDDLSSELEVALEELSVLTSHNGGNHDVDRVADHLSLGVSEDFGETLGRLENLSERLFVSTHVDNGGVVGEEYVQ